MNASQITIIPLRDCELRREGAQWVLYTFGRAIRALDPQETLLVEAALQAGLSAQRASTGHCTQGDRCVCGGDTQPVREGCYYWRKG